MSSMQFLFQIIFWGCGILKVMFIAILFVTLIAEQRGILDSITTEMQGVYVCMCVLNILLKLSFISLLSSLSSHYCHYVYASTTYIIRPITAG